MPDARETENAGDTRNTMVTAVTWVDVRDGLPSSGAPVAAAITGRYPADGDAGSGADAGEAFWLVRPMYFTTLHWSDDGVEHRNCFVDSDGVVRLPHSVVRPPHSGDGDDRSDGGDGRPGGPETVTHWAALPTLPGGTTHGVLGADVGPALRAAWGKRPPSA
ncbi:AQJ64_40280 family protein [Streptomyces sp. NPDC058417]|uniref:AQJ64_40280 family protein n=1 Tax=unclassified Streptomyces TaxID=2593676 RepID=UPI00365FF245